MKKRGCAELPPTNALIILKTPNAGLFLLKMNILLSRLAKNPLLRKIFWSWKQKNNFQKDAIV